MLFCIPKILKNESNSQQFMDMKLHYSGCFVSQRYWKMKAIHNILVLIFILHWVVLYPKDTEKWKQFTTEKAFRCLTDLLFCIPKILKNESNSQPGNEYFPEFQSCFVSQRYWKMKAIHNPRVKLRLKKKVVLYPKDTEKWKQFTTVLTLRTWMEVLFCIPKILKNESNSQLLHY